jgi:hypothetical protein
VESGLSLPDARGHRCERLGKAAATAVKRSSGGILYDLGEALHSVQFEETIDRRKQIPVIEDAEAGAEDERWDRRPGESKARAEVQRMLRQGGR